MSIASVNIMHRYNIIFDQIIFLCNIPSEIRQIIVEYMLLDFYFNQVNTLCAESNINVNRINKPIKIYNKKSLLFQVESDDSTIIDVVTVLSSNQYSKIILIFQVDKIGINPVDEASHFPRFRIRNSYQHQHRYNTIKNVYGLNWGKSINNSPTCIYAYHGACSEESQWVSLNLKENDLVKFYFNFIDSEIKIYINDLETDIYYDNIPTVINFGIDLSFNAKITFIDQIYDNFLIEKKNSCE